MKRAVSIALAALLLSTTGGTAYGKRTHHEKWYQEKWCSDQGGESEVTLPDRTRCDCITADHAVEVDFGDKWAEGIGQSLYYGLQTGKRPGILLILESVKDRKYYLRLNSVIQEYGLTIDVWMIGEGAY